MTSLNSLDSIYILLDMNREFNVLWAGLFQIDADLVFLPDADFLLDGMLVIRSMI